MAFLQKMAISIASSEAKRLIKKAISSKTGGFFEKLMAEKPEKTAARVEEIIGYPTSHYKLGKDRSIQFKPTPIFLFEFLTMAPQNVGRLIKDEESGQVFIDGVLMDNATKIKLINNFLEVTKVPATNIHNAFEAALKLFTPEDLVASKFKSAFVAENDSTEIIDNFLFNCFGEGISTDLPYANNLFRKWVVGTARRAMSPGERLNGCFTFSGPPGTGKTSFFRQMIPPPFDMRTGEVDCKDIKSPDKLIETIIGKTIVCFDELAVLSRFNIEAFKSLMTKQSIQVRLPYHKAQSLYQIRTGFSATTNKVQFITDGNMSRRMWVIELNGKKRCDFDYLHANREALWKEAVRLAGTDFSCDLSPEEQTVVETVNAKHLI
jgi:hypothetical protein